MSALQMSFVVPRPGKLRSEWRQLRCEGCSQTYRIQKGVPVFIREEVNLRLRLTLLSKPIGADFEAILRLR